MTTKNTRVREVMDAAEADYNEDKNAISEADRVKLAIMATLEALGGLSVGDDDIQFVGDKIVLPSSYQGRVGDAVKYLRQYQEEQENHFAFARSFRYRPWDGAHAFSAALKRNFGTTGLGKATMTMFGPIPPALISIDTSFGKSEQVPWGEVSFPPLEATFTLGNTRDREFGSVFQLHVEAPKKYRKHIEAFFNLVEKELKENSIYKGKAITGGPEPVFQDVSKFDPNKVVFSEEVLDHLNANVWSLLEYTNQMRELKLPLKRAILLEGPHGTGKTLAGALTAQKAVANGWTYILCRPGVDDLAETLKTAQIYAPAVVWFEDIETVAQGGTSEHISKILDMLDGITSKGVEVLVGFTTNHVGEIQKGVLRPGRLDAVITVAGLDTAGFEKLTKSLIPAKLLGDIDYAEVGKAFEGFLPAFAAEAINRAIRYSIARNKGRADIVTTHDLVNAASGLRPQLELMNAAKGGANNVTLSDTFEDLMRGVINKTEMMNNHETGNYVLQSDPDLEVNVG